MPLSIKNPRAEQLAREVAALSKENLTQVIIHSLEERLERLQGRRTSIDIAEEIMKISKRCSSLPDQDTRTADEILGYNQIGIPE
ncbi:MAG: type II toxin-antitoxin system VapB family antitoxin [Deltaproteobacteria bacterium]|nr:type II toxin-antitoxin system VapB family antitoxin [Deltaproteobacteria bacterium]